MFRELAKDPMQNKRMVRKYESEVEQQYNLLVKQVKKIFPALTPDLETMSALYLILINQYITNPVQRQVLAYVNRSAMQGDYSARLNLKSIGFTAAVGVLPVDPKVLDILQQRNIAALKGITDDMAKTFKQEVSEGILRGESVPELTKRVTESIGVSKNRARTMVRTETAFAFNTARIDQFKKYGVEKVRWFTARDERVCTRPIKAPDGETYAGCKGLHNKVFDIDKLPFVTAHVNCRCVQLAIVEEVD